MDDGSQRTNSDFDVVVVGSGFGGAVTAARLAEAGMRVLVLERGPWWGTAQKERAEKVTRPFPRRLSQLAGFVRAVTRTDERGERVLLSRPQGLFDVHLWPGVTNVVGSGVGGGSLVYAGYQSRPAPGFFDEHFPAEISDAEMTPYFERVAAMQRPERLPYPVASREVFADGLTRAGLGAPETPLLANRFGEPGSNSVGNPQNTCQDCGACVIGCTENAKTTLDTTYLSLAQKHGAQIRELCEVTGIGGSDHRYQVMWRDHRTGTDHVMTTPRLVLAGGTIGTMRLLYAARDRHRSMRLLPLGLGRNFSGNGDYLTMLRRSRAAAHHGQHAMFRSVYRDDDGGFIGEAAPPVEQLPLPASVRRELAESVFLFSTGCEPGTRLDSIRGRPFALPYKSANAAYYARVADRVGAIAQAYRPASTRQNWPMGPRSDRLVTVHPVGGASIASSPEAGVVDHTGEVFGHRGLYVADGSLYPEAPGVPPSMGIAALAERQAALMIGEGR